MKFHYLILSLFMLISFSSCEEEEEKDQETSSQSAHQESPIALEEFNKMYKGFINEKYEIVMNLRLNNQVLHGYYYYTKYEKQIVLKGQINSKDNTFTLSEYDADGMQTGTFRGRIANDYSLSGNWSAYSDDEDGEEMPFSLEGNKDLFVWYNEFVPFHPRQVEKLSNWEGTLTDVNLNDPINTDGIIMYEPGDEPANTMGFEYDEEPMMRVPFFQYTFLGSNENIYYASVVESGGGTGIFTHIKVMEENDGVLKEIDAFSGGDRCNGGLAGSDFRDGKLIYSVNITTGDLFAYSDFSTGYNYDLDFCAICCAAEANMEYDFNTGEGKLTSFTLMEGAYGFDDEGIMTVQNYFYSLLDNHINEKGTELSIEDLDEIAKELIDWNEPGC